VTLEIVQKYLKERPNDGLKTVEPEDSEMQSSESPGGAETYFGSCCSLKYRVLDDK
jgi:hypothetical protein